MIRNFRPLPWRAKGLSDSVDGSTAFNGAMASLQNLIPDPTTAELWQCRPAAVSIATFPGGPFSSGFSAGFMHSTGNVTALKIVGNVAYGMVSLGDGFDHPFALNLLTNAFITVTGTTGSNLPQSQPSSGPWTPPIMDLIGSKMVVTHPGFSATAFFIGWFDISTPTAPVWNAGNITGAAGVPFTQPPIGVAQFFNRAYYMVNYVLQPEVIISDPLNPLAASGASGAGTVVPILTFGDNTPLTAFGQLRLFNQLGGIIQALIVFKGTSNIYQITGDLAFASASNPQPAIYAMNFATGTLAPLSLCSTPRGLAFVAPDGLRIIDFSANVSDPIGYDGQGVSAPFIFSGTPSRMCAACNGNVIRISTQNILLPTGGYQEYWYDIERKIWSGPHTFPASVIQPYGNSFVMAGQGVLGQLWRSDVVQSASSSFVEGGNPLSYSYTTAFLPDTDQLGNIHVSQSLLTCALSATVAPVQANALNPRKLPWHFPLVFARAQFSVTGQSASPVRLGAFQFRYKQLRYLTDIGAAA